MIELAASTQDKVKEAVKVNSQLEQRLNELTAKHEKSVEVFTEQLNNAHKMIRDNEKEFSVVLQKYQELLGANRKSANELRAEPIDLPTDVDQLQFMCLTTKEELIETKAAREHCEQALKDEVAMLRTIEQEILAQNNHLQTELGIANSKVSSSSEMVALSESFQRQVRDLQVTVKELEDQVTQVQSERSAVEKTAQNYKQRCASLQHELDTSEAVQRDFVKLSQSLQIQLEKIRQSEQEVRWQWDEDVDKCTNCETSVAKLRPKPHCRHCGKIFCISCVKDTVPSGPQHRPANVCQVCHTLLNRDSKPFFATREI
ncbi:unnamed protein product [Caenorhabditis auriculariae]|uniref:FYVE-type domain-containing protein n=1 Tax=Caenorhabditis auriculariae TaxID=2777116 RepID=A0A8S1HCS4_9PELO|nr:unnamed protein product [Caenorhabditis auriculariae]